MIRSSSMRGFTPLENPKKNARHTHIRNGITRSGSLTGFTLIELLVVVAIIGMLSSVLLSSLNFARSKAKDASIRSHVRQMQTMLALQHGDSGSYTNLQYGWAYSAADCAADFTGTYAAKMREMCSKIVTLNGGAAGGMYTGVTVAGTDYTRQYSIAAYLPAKGAWLCAGPSGSSDGNTSSAALTGTGCPDNP